MNKPFRFTVSDAKGPLCARGEYRDGAGMALAMGDGYERSLVESAVVFLAAEPAAVSANLINGWVVARV